MHKRTSLKLERLLTEQEKILANHLSTKAITSRIYIELFKLTKGKPSNKKKNTHTHTKKKQKKNKKKTDKGPEQIRLQKKLYFYEVEKQ